MSNRPADFVFLALNSGSSSFKLALYSFQNGIIDRLALGEAEEIGSTSGRVWLRSNGDLAHHDLANDERRSFVSAGVAAEHLIEALRKTSLPHPLAVGHRIVHGGPRLREHQRITPEVLAQLAEAVSFAPLHLPPALDVVRRAMDAFPNVPHIACFDTAFHRTMPEHAARLPFGREFFAQGLQRYGFHGLSCESAVRVLGSELAQRTVVAHLGNGCSITAIQNGFSMDTTMGLTPTGGVMMGTRSGDLDPGIVLNLLRAGYDYERLDALVNHSAGLLGVSGGSSDMRRLLEVRGRDVDARLAVKMFCYQIAKSIAAMAAVLGGIDMLVFTGGIGENSGAVRAEICSGLRHLGISLNNDRNQRNAANIADGECDVRVIAADEDLEIALYAMKLGSESIC
jgi:acetate kinase